MVESRPAKTGTMSAENPSLLKSSRLDAVRPYAIVRLEVGKAFLSLIEREGRCRVVH